jgi:hypothetical protein
MGGDLGKFGDRFINPYDGRRDRQQWLDMAARIRNDPALSALNTALLVRHLNGVAWKALLGVKFIWAGPPGDIHVLEMWPGAKRHATDSNTSVGTYLRDIDRVVNSSDWDLFRVRDTMEQIIERIEALRLSDPEFQVCLRFEEAQLKELRWPTIVWNRLHFMPGQYEFVLRRQWDEGSWLATVTKGLRPGTDLTDLELQAIWNRLCPDNRFTRRDRLRPRLAEFAWLGFSADEKRDHERAVGPYDKIAESLLRRANKLAGGQYKTEKQRLEWLNDKQQKGLEAITGLRVRRRSKTQLVEVGLPDDMAAAVDFESGMTIDERRLRNNKNPHLWRRDPFFETEPKLNKRGKPYYPGTAFNKGTVLMRRGVVIDGPLWPVLVDLEIRPAKKGSSVRGPKKARSSTEPKLNCYGGKSRPAGEEWKPDKPVLDAKPIVEVIYSDFEKEQAAQEQTEFDARYQFNIPGNWWDENNSFAEELMTLKAKKPLPHSFGEIFFNQRRCYTERSLRDPDCCDPSPLKSNPKPPDPTGYR